MNRPDQSHSEKRANRRKASRQPKEFRFILEGNNMTRFRQRPRPWLAWGTLLAIPASAEAVTPGALLGGDLGVNPAKQDLYEVRLDTLADLGIGWVRVGIPPDHWWNLTSGQATPALADPVVNGAVARGLQPWIQLDFSPQFHPTYAMADFDWRAAGQAFASHFQNRVTHFAILNEPDHLDNTLTPPQVVAAVTEFAAGVHRVSPSLKVITGGFANFMVESKIDAMLKALAPLFNDGTLHALNLHSYMSTGDVALPNLASRTPNTNFAARKAQSGITADIAYCAGEWNMRGDLPEAERARRFFTLIWDHLGVQSPTGEPRTLFAGAYQIWGAPADKKYVLAENRPAVGATWAPKLRGQVLQQLLQRTENTDFVEMRPDLGRFKLERRVANPQTVWVVQNRTGWQPQGTQSEVILEDVPPTATSLEVVYWDGLDQTLSLTTPAATVTVSGLRPDETVLLIANAVSPTAPANPALPVETENNAGAFTPRSGCNNTAGSAATCLVLLLALAWTSRRQPSRRR